MTYSIDSIDHPSRVRADEPFELSADICCTNPDGCSDEQASLTFAGYLVGEESMGLIWEQCYTALVAGWTYRADPPFPNPDLFTTQRFDEDLDGDMVVHEPGDYTIEVTMTSGQSMTSSITVDPPLEPEFVVEGCSVSPTQLDLGDDAVAEITVFNQGDAEGTALVEFLYDGAVVAEFEPTLSPGGSTTESVEVQPETPGDHDIDYRVTELNA